MTAEQRRGIWDGSECALVFIDYQDSVIADVWEQDRRVVELHARTLAMAAVGFGVPVVLSTVAVKMGKNTPIMPSLHAAVPGVEPIDRSTMDAWEDPAFLDAVADTTKEQHDTALVRLAHAGAHPEHISGDHLGVVPRLEPAVRGRGEKDLPALLRRMGGPEASPRALRAERPGLRVPESDEPKAWHDQGTGVRDY